MTAQWIRKEEKAMFSVGDHLPANYHLWPDESWFHLVINPFHPMGYNGYILKSEVGMRKSEVGSGNAEVGSGNAEVGSGNAEVGSGNRKIEFGIERFGRISDSYQQYPSVVTFEPLAQP